MIGVYVLAVMVALFILYVIFHKAVNVKIESALDAAGNEIDSVEGKVTADFRKGAHYVIDFLKKHVGLAVLVLAVMLTPAFGQTANFASGRFVASEYTGWTMNTLNSVAAGSASVTLANPALTGNQCFAYTKSAGAKPFVPLVVGGLLTVSDANSETVTVTAVSGCSVTATFSYAHNIGVPVISGDGGVVEAARDAVSKGGGLVVVGPDFTGTTSTLASITSLPGPGVVIEDTRNGPPVYWGLRPTATTLISAPSAPTVTVVTGSLSSGAYYAKVAYVDCLTGISLPSSDSTQTATTTGLVITSPAATTGACGWLPYITAAGGGTGTEILAKDPIDSTICTLSTLTAVPSCAIGSSATITAANPSATSKPVVESTAHTTLGLVAFGAPPPPFQTNYTPFVATATLNNSNADAAVVYIPAGFFNYLGKPSIVCVKGASATAVASSALTLNLTMSNKYAQSPVTVSTVALSTQTRAAAGTFQGCWFLSTAATGSSGNFWAMGYGNFVEFLNSAPATQIIGTDASAAVSSNIDLTKGIYLSINLQETGSQNITVPIINMLSINPINY